MSFFASQNISDSVFKSLNLDFNVLIAGERLVTPCTEKRVVLLLVLSCVSFFG